MTPLILVVVILGVVLVGGSVLLLRRSESDPLAARINEYAGRDVPVTMDEIEMSLPITDRVFVPIIRRISNLIIRYTPQSTLTRTAKQLELAGSRSMSAAQFLMLRGVASVVMGILFFFVMGRYGAEPGRRLFYALVMAIFGFMLPSMLLRARIDRRKKAIIKKLPDALDLMTICVDAGLTFDGAIAKVDEKWDDPLAREFGRVVYEIQLGKSKRQSLRDMSDRMDVPDVTSFIASILQAEQLGVSIGRVLRIQSEQMRLRRRQRAEEQAQQASIKMLFPLVFLIFPSMFIVLLGPAGLQVARSSALRGIGGG